MAEVKTETLVIYDNTDVIALVKDWELSVENEIIDITTLDSGGVKKKLDGITDWKFTMNALYDPSPGAGKLSALEVLTRIKAGTAITWKLSSGVSGDNYLYGTGLFQSMNLSGATGDVVQSSYALEGNSELQVGTEA